MEDHGFLTDLLECSVCLEQLDTTSRVLPCQHTFCRRCLMEIAANHAELRCPECRILVEMSVDELPANILLIRLLEGLKNNNVKQRSLRGGPLRPQVPNGQSVQNLFTGPLRWWPPAQSTDIGLPLSPASSTATTGQGGVMGDGLNKSMAGLSMTGGLHRAKALFNYDGKEPGDLSFSKGDVILLRMRIDANWFQGEYKGKIGFLPASYVHLLGPGSGVTNSIPTQCKTNYEFRVAGAVEEKVALKGDPKSIVSSPMNLSSSTPNSTSTAASSSSSSPSVKVVTAVSANLPLTTTTSSTSSSSSSSKGLKKTFVPMSQNSSSLYSRAFPTHRAGNGQVSGQKRHSLCVPGSSGSRGSDEEEKRKGEEVEGSKLVSSSPSTSHRHSMEMLSGGMEEERSKVGRKDGQCQEGGMRGWQVELGRNLPMRCSWKRETSLLESRPSSTSQSPSTPIYYVALYNYKPQKTDEVELRKGELYSVNEKCQDGWFKGTSLRTNLSGVFPGNYVQLFKQPPPPSSSSSSISSLQQQIYSNGSMECKDQNGSGYGIIPPPRPKPSFPNKHTSFQSSSSGANSNGGVYARPRPSPSFISSSNGVGGGFRWAKNPPPPPPAPPQRPPKNPTSPSTSGDENSSSHSSPQWHQPKVAATRGQQQHQQLPPPPPLPQQQQQHYNSEKKKEKISLMKRLTSKRKSKSPPPGVKNGFSCDNPSFVDGCGQVNVKMHQMNSNIVLANPGTSGSSSSIHVRSSSCPSDVLGGEEGRRRMVTHRPPPLIRERYRCIVPYPPNTDYELELMSGDIVFVHKKREDGWFKGTLQRTGKTGLFPSSFVEAF